MQLFDPHDVVTTGQLVPFPATAINYQTLPCHILKGLFDCFKAFIDVRLMLFHVWLFPCTRRYSCFVVIEGQIGDRPYEDAGEQWRSPRGLRALHCRLR